MGVCWRFDSRLAPRRAKGVVVATKSRVQKIERELYSTKEACEYMQRAEITLKKWRSKGLGPAWHRDSHGRIWYQKSDLDKFLNGGGNE